MWARMLLGGTIPTPTRVLDNDVLRHCLTAVWCVVMSCVASCVVVWQGLVSTYTPPTAVLHGVHKLSPLPSPPPSPSFYSLPLVPILNPHPQKVVANTWPVVQPKTCIGHKVRFRFCKTGLLQRDKFADKEQERSYISSLFLNPAHDSQQVVSLTPSPLEVDLLWLVVGR